MSSSQAYRSKKFMKYDYGIEENMDVYHQVIQVLSLDLEVLIPRILFFNGS